MASGLLLGIRLGFNNHAPEELPIVLALHQQAANQVGGDQLGGAGEEGLGEVLGGRGDGLGGGYGSGYVRAASNPANHNPPSYALFA